MYLNGNLSNIFNKPADKPDASDSDFEIGCWHSLLGNYYFNGDIDNVCVWNRTLTAEEINASYILGITSEFQDMLTEWIIKNDNESRDDFKQAMQDMMPDNIFFQVKIFDGYTTKWWYKSEKQELATTVIRSHYIISQGTYIYSVELEMWSI